MKNSTNSNRNATESISLISTDIPSSELLDPSRIVYIYKISIQDIIDILLSNNETEDLNLLIKEKSDIFLDRVRYDIRKFFEYNYENHINNSVEEIVNTILEELKK